FPGTDEVITGKSCDWIEPPVPCPAGGRLCTVGNPPLPPPMSEGGTKGPAATRVELGIRALGMGCIDPLLGALTAVEPVTVRSATKALLPSAVQPESAAAPATIPASATALIALRDTRLLISPLVRRYSMGLTVAA